MFKGEKRSHIAIYWIIVVTQKIFNYGFILTFYVLSDACYHPKQKYKTQRNKYSF